jgi:hypothetical protein
MSDSNTDTLFSQKYIEILATVNGHQVFCDPIKPSAIRIREVVERKLPKGKRAKVFTNREIKGHILPVSESQIRQNKGAVKIGIDPIIYSEIAETSSYQVPTVLFLCVWPTDKKGAIIFSREALSMICTCYWFLLDKKAKPSSGTKAVNIEIPHEQIINESAFGEILDKIYT